jgi:hypothetical protein
MRLPLAFLADLRKQPRWVFIWVLYLVAIHLCSAAFWSEPLAKAILAVFALSSTLMMVLYARFGFVRLLGLGHLPWVPLLAFVVTRIAEADGPFRLYLVIYALSAAVSLVFDTVDVYRHFADRAAIPETWSTSGAGMSSLARRPHPRAPST